MAMRAARRAPRARARGVSLLSGPHSTTETRYFGWNCGKRFSQCRAPTVSKVDCNTLFLYARNKTFISHHISRSP